jgi:hypothetical protein
MTQRPETLDALRGTYTSMNQHLENPDSWKPLTISDLASKCLCIFTMGQWKLAPGTWDDLQKWLEPLCQFGILYDVSSEERGRLHFTLHQCSGFHTGPFETYEGDFLDGLLKQLSGLSIRFRGLVVTPTGIALRGFPTTDKELQKLMKVRSQLASAFTEAGIPFHPPYINDICHATLFRWSRTPTFALIQYIQKELSHWEHAVLADLQPSEWHFGYGTLTMRPNEIVYLKRYWTPLHIAHRGLIEGPNPELENSIETLTSRKKAGLHSEIDIWWTEGKFWIGHDFPREPVTLEFLNSSYFWIHAKHDESFRELQRVSNENGLGLRIFYHTDEDYVLTTTGDTIIYPGLDDCPGWVYMMPEAKSIRPSVSAAICSDYLL